ncbi:unnamed protein product [Phaedon cochleariae]|uniref:C2H2-type domain-containing protein n=1 Tax=Phaedon cochleariae TaxID=80249 RepID=A0A9N9SGE3_PHACE|nr:unnamed protein product [Phaedon cochleariae]
MSEPFDQKLNFGTENGYSDTEQEKHFNRNTEELPNNVDSYGYTSYRCEPKPLLMDIEIHEMELKDKIYKDVVKIARQSSYILFDLPEYSCPNCYKIYAKKSTLARHISYECGKPPRFGCSMCSYRGFQKTHVERHLAKRHDLHVKYEIRKHIVTYGHQTK